MTGAELLQRPPGDESVGLNRLICSRAVGLRTASSSYG
jgi:hypothetical protein